MTDIEELEEAYWEQWLDEQEYIQDIKEGNTNMPYDMWKISKFVIEKCMMKEEDKR